MHQTKSLLVRSDQHLFSREKALPGFHAFTGADNTGNTEIFDRQIYMVVQLLKAGDDVLKALKMLSKTSDVQ